LAARPRDAETARAAAIKKSVTAVTFPPAAGPSRPGERAIERPSALSGAFDCVVGHALEKGGPDLWLEALGI
jgi:hypothetical protein